MDKLELINKIIEAHQVIRRDLSVIGKAVSDREAMFSLDKEQYNWTPGQPGDLEQKQKKFEENLNRLDQGLKRHFALEEEHLPPLFGDLLMQGLLSEHHDLLEGVNHAREMIASSRSEAPSREKSLERQSTVQGIIEGISLRIEDHASREEVIFDMLREALENNPDRR